MTGLRALLVGGMILTLQSSLTAAVAGNTVGRHCTCGASCVSDGFSASDVLHGFGSGEGDGSVVTPARLFLDQNYPNPFNPSTMIRYGLPDGSLVKITIHTLLGNQVKVVLDGYQDAGVYTLNLAAQDLPSGVYFYRLQTDYGTLTRRMTISK